MTVGATKVMTKTESLGGMGAKSLNRVREKILVKANTKISDKMRETGMTGRPLSDGNIMEDMDISNLRGLVLMESLVLAEVMILAQILILQIVLILAEA